MPTAIEADKIIQELKSIESVSLEIMKSDLDEGAKYEMIFSDRISRRVYKLFNQTKVSFDYYDPDTSYEEDSNAFVTALSKHISQLEAEFTEIMGKVGADHAVYEKFYQLTPATVEKEDF